MDPLSALAVATAALQFLDFGAKVMVETVARYTSTDSTTEDRIQIEALIARLDVLVEHLGTPEIASRESMRESPFSKQLGNIIQECKAIAGSLRQILANLEYQGRYKLLGSLVMAIKATGKDSRVQRLHNKLLACQSQLSCYLTAMI